MVGFTPSVIPLAFDGEKDSIQRAGTCKSIEAVNMIIFIDMLNTPFRQERRGRKYHGR